MIDYTNIHLLLKRKKLSLRKLQKESGIDYGTLWRLLRAKNNKQIFETEGRDKGKVIMNLTADTLDKLCHFLKKQPGGLLKHK